MKILTYGEIIEAGKSVFTAVANLDDGKLGVSFRGVIRIDHPEKELSPFIEELFSKLGENDIYSCELDFTELTYCNSNGFYSLMDIIEVVYDHTACPVTIKRLQKDDWHKEILPILLNLDNMQISERTNLVGV
jgi:hypothetical protein